jgi:hypothetical protein
MLKGTTTTTYGMTNTSLTGMQGLRELLRCISVSQKSTQDIQKLISWRSAEVLISASIFREGLAQKV